MNAVLVRGTAVVCALALILPVYPCLDSAQALAPSSHLNAAAQEVAALYNEKEIRDFIRQVPLSEGHAHFGGSLPSAYLWRLALKRLDISDQVWDAMSAKVSQALKKTDVDLKSLIHEGRRLQADASMDPETRGKELGRLQERFAEYTLYLPQDEKSLSNFIKMYSIPGTLSKGPREIVREVAREIALKGYEDGLRLLELRASLAKGKDENEIYRAMQERIEAICDGLRDAEHSVQTRLTKGQIGLETRIVLTAEKENSIDAILQQTYAFLDVLEYRPDLREYVVGFDAANKESDKAPTEFIPVIEEINKYNDRRVQEGQPKLGLTYHVGEDFSDTTVESGIRHVNEVLEMGIGRIGHGLVLGVDVDQYLGKKQEEKLSERIAQIYYDLRNAKFDADGLEAVGLKIDADKLNQELRDYAADHAFVREQILPLLGDILRQDELDAQKQKALYAVLNEMRNTTGYPSFSKTYTQKDVDELLLRQNYVLNKVIENEAVIETNPTSNISIGPVPNYESHPIRRFLAYRYPKVKGKYWLAGRCPIVTINTDDAGVFGVTTAEEYARIATAQGWSAAQIKKLAINGMRHRLSNHPLRYREAIMANLGPDVEKELRGYPVVHTRFGDVQFTVPPETARDVIKMHAEGKPFPTVFVLPPELFVAGNNYADIEFVLYFFGYILHNGLKIRLVAAPEQEAAMRSYLENSLFGIDFKSVSWRAFRSRWIRALTKARGKRSEIDPEILKEIWLLEKSIQAAQNSLAAVDIHDRVLGVDDFLEFVPLQDGVAEVVMVNPKEPQTVLGKVEIRRDKTDPTRFTVKETACAVKRADEGYRLESVPDALMRNVQVDYAVPYVSPEQISLEDREALSDLNRPRLGYTQFNRNNGFDTEGDVSSCILWVGKKGILIDPSLPALRKMKALGLTADDVPYVLLTHNHADHDRGLLKWLFRNPTVTLLASEPVYRSFLKKSTALLGEDVENYVVFQPLLDDIPLEIPMMGKERASITIRHNLHSIPTIGFKLHYAYEGKTYGIGFSGDDIYETLDQGKKAKYKKALKLLGVSDDDIRALDDKRTHFFWDENGKLHDGLNVVLHEADQRDRTDPNFIHTSLQVLDELPAETRKAVNLCHMAEKNFPVEGYGATRPMQTATILESDEQLVQDYRMQQVALVSLFSDMPRDKFDEMLKAGTVKKYSAGEHLITQGKGTVIALTEPPNGIPANIQRIIRDETTGAFFVILSGEVEIERDGKPVGPPVGPGATVGEWALVTHQPRSGTVKAGAAGVTVLSWSAEFFEKFINSPEFTAKVLAAKENLPFFQSLQNAGGPDSPLKYLDIKVRMDLAIRARRKSFEHDQAIVRQGETGDAAYIIKSGRVKVFQEDGTEIATLSKGQVFGEMALLQEAGRRSATVLADGPVEVLRIDQDQFQAVRRNWPQFNRAMIGLAQARSRADAMWAKQSPPASRRKRFLLENLLSADDQVRLSAAKELLNRGDVRGLSALLQLAQTSLRQRTHAQKALQDSPWSTPRNLRSIAVMSEASREMRNWAIDSLATYTDEESARTLAALLNTWRYQSIAEKSLFSMGSSIAAVLNKILQEESSLTARLWNIRKHMAIKRVLAVFDAQTSSANQIAAEGAVGESA